MMLDMPYRDVRLLVLRHLDASAKAEDTEKREVIWARLREITNTVQGERLSSSRIVKPPINCSTL